MMPLAPLAQITPLLSGCSGIAVDVAHRAVAQVHADAAAARAHVAGGGLDLGATVASCRGSQGFCGRSARRSNE